MTTEMPEFWAMIQIQPDSPAAKPKAVLRKEQAPAVWTQTLGLYSHGYSCAFERLLMVTLQHWPNADYLQFPVFYLARHAAELSLKEVVEAFIERTGLRMDTSKIHGLLELWDMANNQLTAAGFSTDNDWTKRCRKLVQHLHEGDPDGQRFRYPHNNAGVKFEYQRVELMELAIAHANIRMWCECSTQLLEDI